MLDYRLTMDDRAALVRLHLQALQDAIDLAPAVIEVINRFNGKQANKRIDTALKAVNKNLRFSAVYSWAEIEMWIENRSMRGGQPDEYGYQSTAYLSTSTVQIAHACSYTGEKAHLSPIIDGRLNAPVMVESIRFYTEQHRAAIENTLKQLQEVEALKAERERCIKATQAFNAGLQDIIDDYFELRIKG